MVIGIPRALLYYHYYPWVKTFFDSLEIDTMLSPETNKKILDDGVKTCVDEACLPLKVAYGHILDLYDKNVDFIFIPRIISVENKRYMCSNFLGLPDMVRAMLNISNIIDLNIYLYKDYTNIYKEAYKLGRCLNRSKKEINMALDKANSVQMKYFAFLKKNLLPSAINNFFNKRKAELNNQNTIRIAVLGHPYNIYDNYAGIYIIDKLINMKVYVLTIEMLSEKQINEGARKIDKDMYWTYGRKLMGAGLYLLDSDLVDGVIIITAFGCGADSLIKEILEREYKRRNTIPLLCLTSDEHSGETGYVTRLEAFLDMLNWKKEAL